MSDRPWHTIDLMPGMVREYTIGDIDEELLDIHRNEEGLYSMGSYELAIGEFLKTVLQHPFYFEGTNSGDWQRHIQLSDESDVHILEKYTTVEDSVEFDWADSESERHSIERHVKMIEKEKANELE